MLLLLLEHDSDTECAASGETEARCEAGEAPGVFEKEPDGDGDGDGDHDEASDAYDEGDTEPLDVSAVDDRAGGVPELIAVAEETWGSPVLVSVAGAELE